MPGQGGDVDGDTSTIIQAPSDDSATTGRMSSLRVPPLGSWYVRRVMQPKAAVRKADPQAIALADQQPAARHSLEPLRVLDLPAVQRPDRESAPLPPPLSIRIPAGTHPARLDQAGSSKRVTSRRVAKSTTWTVVGWLSLRAACSHATCRDRGVGGGAAHQGVPDPNQAAGLSRSRYETTYWSL